MSTKPEAGQWWFANDGSGRVYIIGFATDGEAVFEYQEGHIDTDDDDWTRWHHEPRCTGWDWVVPEQPQPEDPDEWVIQDRVPVRVGVDEIHWSDWDVTRWEVASGHWFPETRYGSTQDGAVLSVRCRRRDLPKPQPQKTRVRLWMHYIGGTVVCGSRPSEGWQEIHHDSEGFYVEGGQS